MSQQELLKRVVQVLEDLSIEYMVTGSVSSSVQGEPRLTHDVDLVVDLSIDAAKRLCEAFVGDDYYLSEIAVQEALVQRTMFNLLDLVSGDKVDFWILTDAPFDRSRFARKQPVNILDLSFAISAPEDTILMKLHWAQLSGGSQKQYTDALRVYEVQQGTLDLDYLNAWASRLGVDSLWRQLRTEAMPL
jgi:hypothetical protein